MERAALSMSTPMARAALSVSTPTARAGSPVGVIYTHRERNTDRAALAVGVKI